MSDTKKTTLGEHVADTHAEKPRLGTVVTGDIAQGDVVETEETGKPDAAEDTTEGGEGS